MRVLLRVLSDDKPRYLHFLRLEEILIGYPVIADEWIGEHDDLPRVRGVGEALHIARHTCIEDDLSRPVFRGAGGLALEYCAVLKVELHRKKSPPLGDGLERQKNTPGWVFFVEISLEVIKS